MSSSYASSTPDLPPEALYSEVVRPFVRVFVRPSVCYKACEHNILKMNEPILMPVSEQS